MPRVTFISDFDCPCKPGVYIAYKVGGPKLIPTAHAKLARAAGVLADGEGIRTEVGEEHSATAKAAGASSDRRPRGGSDRVAASGSATGTGDEVECSS